MAEKNDKDTGKIKDVAGPGETPDSPNARPTITGHQPMIKKDPMMSKGGDGNDVEQTDGDTKHGLSASKKIKINPISEDVKPEAKTGDDKQPDKPLPEKKEDDQSAPEDEAKPAAKSENQEAGSESGAIGALAESANSNKKADAKQEEEEKKRREKVDALIKEGKYRLPIVEGGHRASSQRFVSWVFLILLLASAGVYLAIDGGYLNVGFDLPYDLIKN